MEVIEDEQFCRICHINESELISPCLCDGSMKFVHESCLKKWMKFSGSIKCELCKFSYSITQKLKFFQMLSFIFCLKILKKLFGIFLDLLLLIYTDMIEKFGIPVQNPYCYWIIIWLTVMMCIDDIYYLVQDCKTFYYTANTHVENVSDAIRKKVS